MHLYPLLASLPSLLARTEARAGPELNCSTAVSTDDSNFSRPLIETESVLCEIEAVALEALSHRVFSAMATLECRAAGTVDEAQLEQLIELLVGLSGAQPEPIEQHEVVLKAPPAAASTSGAPAAWKPDLRLQRDLQPPGSAEQGEAEPDT